MKILAIDTSSEIGGISILDKERGKIYNRRIENTSRVAESIYSHLKNAFLESGYQLSDIDIFSTVLGPGSFTGLRVSLSVLKAFVMALQKPLIGIETFKVMAYSAIKIRGSDSIFVIGNARRDELFISLYDRELNEKMPIRIIPSTKLSDFLKDDNIVAVYRDIEVQQFIPEYIDHIKMDKDLSSNCAELGLNLYNSGVNIAQASDIEPLYVRDDVVRIKT